MTLAPSAELAEFLADFVEGLRVADSRAPVAKTPRHTFRPGIGPFPEAEAISLAMQELRALRPGRYDAASPERYAGTRAVCDLVAPRQFAAEFKLVRPFGDNGKEAEHWSQNLLHPYPGNVSLLADCMKLNNSFFHGQRWVVAFGYEHTPPQVPLEPTVRAFELLAEHVIGVRLSERVEHRATGLVHPVHQQVVAAGWQLHG